MTKKENADKKTAPVTTVEAMPDAPDGFILKSKAQSNLFHDIKPQQDVVGLYVGQYAMADKRDSTKVREMIQIKVSKPCTIKRPDPADPKTYIDAMAEPGEIINVDMRTGMADDFEDIVPGKDEVLIRFLEKINIGGGKTFWRTEVYHKPQVVEAQA